MSKDEPSRSTVHDLIAAFSLSNLSLIGLWNALLNYSPAQAFFFAHEPSRAQYGAALANVFLIGVILFALIRLARRAHARFGPIGSAPVLLLAALPAIKAVVRLLALKYPSWGPRGFVEIFILLFVLAATLMRRRIFAAAAALLIMVSPLVPIEAILSVARCWPDRSAAYANSPLAARRRSDSKPRIVWIIFDELDYRLAFPGRPSGLDMPEFDRLRAESLFAENAMSPAIDTVQSVPSLLIGKTVATVEARGPAEMMLDGAPLRSLPSVFSSIHSMGGNAAVVGWYLPYCRLFSQDLAGCSWRDLENPLNETGGTFAESLGLQQQSLFEYGYISIFPESLSARHRIAMLRGMRQDALGDIADPSLDFVFLHLPVPHAPHFYDRVSRNFTRRNSGVEGYRDSLALADAFLGDFRASLTQAGLWNTTTVLVSSDHKWKSSMKFDGKSDPRVPFLLKLAGQSSGVIYSAPLHTVVTKSLLEAVFEHQVASAEDAVKWFAAIPNSPTSSQPSAR